MAAAGGRRRKEPSSTFADDLSQAGEGLEGGGTEGGCVLIHVPALRLPQGPRLHIMAPATTAGEEEVVGNAGAANAPVAGTATTSCCRGGPSSSQWLGYEHLYLRDGPSRSPPPPRSCRKHPFSYQLSKASTKMRRRTAAAATTMARMQFLPSWSHGVAAGGGGRPC